MLITDEESGAARADNDNCMEYPAQNGPGTSVKYMRCRNEMSVEAAQEGRVQRDGMKTKNTSQKQEKIKWTLRLS